MANLSRFAKSGSDWSANELIAYNITILSIPPDEFFPTPDPSLDHIDRDILNSPPGLNTNPAVSNAAATYLGYLDLAVRATQECFIDDFAAETLKLLAFNGRGTAISRNYNIPFTICADGSRVAQADVCLSNVSTSDLLLLVRGKALTNGTDSEAQVVAGAIAAFQFNNVKRRERGFDPLDTMTIPYIMMTGTRPTFYLIPVTTELSNAVITGQYPATQTQVLRCATVAKHVPYISAGMENTEYRKLALKHFLAFKELAKSHWMRILEFWVVDPHTVFG